MSCTRKRGITSGLSCTRKRGGMPGLATENTRTSGTTILRSTSAKRRPGLGSRRPIKPMASRTRASLPTPRFTRRLISRRASMSMGWRQIRKATSNTSSCAYSSSVDSAVSAWRISAWICKRKHSPRSRAPTPTGSRLCNKCKATVKWWTRSSISVSSSLPERLRARSSSGSSR